MSKPVRYGSYLRELATQQQWLGTRSARDAPRWLRLLCEPGTALLSLAAILVLYQLLILRGSPAGGWNAVVGLAVLVLGIALFREGVRAGLVPLGNAFARAAAARSPLAIALGVAFVLGLSLPFAEPIVAALQLAGAHLDPRKDPYLHALLMQRPGTLLLVIGVCTGTAAALGMFRVLRGWSLRPLILVTLVPALGLTGHLLFDPDLARVPALAWDCGALAGGPVTALLLLAFGDGSAGAAGSDRPPLSGFGMIALATSAPVLGVLVYVMILAETTGVDAIVAAAPAAAAARPDPSPWQEIRSALLAVAPLAVVLYVSLRFVLKEILPRPRPVLAGLLFCVLGLGLVNLGITQGLGVLADQAGDGLRSLLGSAAWPAPIGMALAALLAGTSIHAAARAEPALNFFAELADTRTHGILRQARLVRTIAAGAGIGAFIGVLHMATGFEVGWLLIGGGLVALTLAAASGEAMATAAWDGAGTMSGPVTIPMLAAFGAGLAGPGQPGFGLPALCALGSVLAVLATGVLARLLHVRRGLLRNSGFAIS